MAKYYQPSGRFSPSSFIYFIIISLIIIPIIALVYVYLVWYIPFIYINLFITIGFSYAVGMVIARLTIKIGKVRNTTIALIFGFLGGLIALYFSWAIWVDLVVNANETYGNSRIGITTSNIKIVQVFDLVLHPQIIFNLASKINNVGTWGLRGGAVSGTFLTIIWVIELLIVISVLIPYFGSKIPFCEVDNKWFKEETLPAFNFIGKSKEMITNLENSNRNSFDNIQNIAEEEQESHSHSIFTLYSSERGENFLTIENKRAKKNDKGEIEFEEEELITYISISSELKNKILKK